MNLKIPLKGNHRLYGSSGSHSNSHALQLSQARTPTAPRLEPQSKPGYVKVRDDPNQK